VFTERRSEPVSGLTSNVGMYTVCLMEDEVARLRSELDAITLWNRSYADLEQPDEIDNDAFVARFSRQQVIVHRLRELTANN
jgi:hypothetical protein